MRSRKVENIVPTRKLAFEVTTPLPMETETKASQLQIVVLYTTPESTMQALQYVATLGNGLSPNVKLVDIEVVPYAYSMDRPPIDPGFARQRLEKLAAEVGTSIQAEVLYTRDCQEALVRRLGPASLVLIPVTGFWGRFWRKRLKNNLIQHGHEVVLVPCK